MDRAEDAAVAWGDALPDNIRDMIIPMARRRLAIVTKQIERAAKAEAA
jgi:hypothetical protein